MTACDWLKLYHCCALFWTPPPSVIEAEQCLGWGLKRTLDASSLVAFGLKLQHAVSCCFLLLLPLLLSCVCVVGETVGFTTTTKQSRKFKYRRYWPHTNQYRPSPTTLLVTLTYARATLKTLIFFHRKINNFFSLVFSLNFC